MKIDKKIADAILRTEADNAISAPLDRDWVRKVERVSEMCAAGAPETHIAFLATSMLARAVDAKADLFYIKPNLYKELPNAYSARTLSEKVVVPLSAELGFSIGVSGKQPLNNQPYFRMTFLGDKTPVHGAGRQVFNLMIELIHELAASTPAQARQALRAFIAVRRKYQRRYDDAGDDASLSLEQLLDAIQRLVGAASEGGRRAQAVAAGLLDVLYGEDRVESGRINDPSRHYAGDVVILASEERLGWEKSFEIRDKPVPFSDIAIFGRTCVERGIREAAVVMVSNEQAFVDPNKVRELGEGYGFSMTLFYGWEQLVNNCLFWATLPTPEAAKLAAATIRERLIAVEVSRDAVMLWDSLIANPA
ncbi:restriction endonuclease, SacI family [Asaia lannensis]|uniref:Restriction endonuclease, SacI family n=1 Tax=Asaia lannensis NBRC 102526 TaxID=1307926 RepID=A0ABT1CJ83_9PROT|nr:restriction endonuclease, SacI family [Asaia lannensis]MCO6160917.1 restriction endonuclease, SacI family [Asaia lannensis NBRC 102526]GBR01614.1 restriction endonuclease Sac I [Asaia lannensis NBRC 102526]